MPLAPGTRLGTYEIVAPLGAGGMGEVYRAKDLRLGRGVALKVLPDAFAGDADRIARFEREARTVAGLNHPNIVVLHSVEEEDGIRFITMELVEGQSLDRIVTPGGLPLSRVLDLGIAISEALTAAHERGVVHRDLKPANVMVTREGRVKVLDFGLAKLEMSRPEFNATQAPTLAGPISVAGEVVGTVPYMAPEQLRGEAVDARTDLFALGIILYELATGQRPFSGKTPADVSSSILRDTVEPLASVRADLPGDLDHIIGRCLEKEARYRFQTALEACAELRDLRRTAESGSWTRQQPASQGVASIAVLPFVNRSRSEEEEYFSDGLADELLNMLAKIYGLRVAARRSASTFKGKEVTIAEVGRALNVATVLEGSVRKAGSRVRISVQLVKVSDGYHMWSETYDRTLEDIFAVQDDIAHSVVKELRTTLLGQEPDSKASGELKAEVAKAARGRGQNAEAHRLYLQARHLIERYTREDLAKGIGYLKEALELDSNFALAWAELARAYAREAYVNWVPVAEGYGSAREAAERALSLEPDLAEAHGQMGWIRLVYDWDWRGAEASHRRALELAPGSAAALRGAAMLAHSLGRLEETIGLYHRALEQDPLSSSAYSNLGFSLWSGDRFAEAEESSRKAMELAPQGVGTHANLAVILLARGRSEEALAEAMKESDETWRLWALAIVHHALGRRAESDQALGELVEKAADGSAYSIADVHGARGEADAAFEWLERAYAQRDGGIIDLNLSPHFRFIHRDPRWAAFLKKMGFAD